MESELVTPMNSIKDVGRNSVKVSDFDKHLEKAGGHIGRNVVEITIRMKTIVQKLLMIKSLNLRLRNLDINTYIGQRTTIFLVLHTNSLIPVSSKYI